MSDVTSVPTSRTYVHDRCGGATVVSGDDFETLSNPFAYSSGTMCVTCNAAYGLKNFTWADTGETIAARRRRLRSETPAGRKLALYLVGPALCGLVGALIGYAVRPGEIKPIAVGFFTGAILFPTVLMTLTTRFLFKVDYRAVP